jgi:hypothetical protein
MLYLMESELKFTKIVNRNNGGHTSCLPLRFEAGI